MHPLVYVVLIAGGTLAHFRGDYDTRDLVERHEQEFETDGVEVVECPVCEKVDRWVTISEECPILRNGKAYKRCKYGAYNNKACGDRRDCYRGPDEDCSDITLYDRRCTPGYYCNSNMRKCTGINNALDSNALWFVNPNHRYSLQPPDHRRPSAADLRYPIRDRRHV